MSDEPIDPIARMISLEAAEVATGVAEGRAVADEFLAKLHAGQADIDALFHLVKREAMNAFTPYRLAGLCARLQEALSGGN